MNSKHILKTFKKIKERNWEKIYWAIDIHDTMIKANYSSTELPTDFFWFAESALQRLTERKDCCLILFTCSHQNEIDQYLTLFQSKGIKFDYVNENPEVPNTVLGNFDKKFYTNIYLDDKAGFDPENDWMQIHFALNELEKI